MKVTIQYSIDLEEIPNKVREFLMSTAQKSQSIEAGIRYTISLMDDNMSIDEQLKRIDEVRREMSDIDLTLMDCSDILHGYQRALVQLREPKQQMEMNYDEQRNEETEEG
tara:strand:+ start:1293 stop:1622 length:330 start_codon:yes stop_codon:yes gene_type:complete